MENDKKTYGGCWKYFENFEEILNFSNLLNEKGIREKQLKFSLKKLISRKFFYEIDTPEKKELLTKMDELNKGYEILLQKNKTKCYEDINEIDNNNKDLEMKIEENNEEKKIHKSIEDIEKQNKLLQIFVDIENINHNENDLENILENENNLENIQILMPIEDNENDKKKVEENFNENKISKNEKTEKNINMEIDFDINFVEKKENKLDLIKNNLLILEDKITNYMKNYEKEWESLEIRQKWV